VLGQRELVINGSVRKFNFLANIYRVFRFSLHYSNVYKSELASCIWLPCLLLLQMYHFYPFTDGKKLC